ncbi:uncharacterized protein [Spinacia oleracea]|uniref:RING-type domain-containing protein n=1 Tax=Spinacia oleracea TaxID=3562 RepID=A0A9R0JJB8_SPIOL|nr:uncharacterized protein LOC110776225 [Spinacia oleracea]
MGGKKRSRSMFEISMEEKKLLEKEWDSALCTICLEHPHNASLIICTSHANGCRPYICNQVHRDCNCLRQFLKLNINLRCPLCRGDVLEVKDVEEDVKNYMNSKTRDCAKGLCKFVGNYGELTKHTYRYHPFDDFPVLEDYMISDGRAVEVIGPMVRVLPDTLFDIHNMGDYFESQFHMYLQRW